MSDSKVKKSITVPQSLFDNLIPANANLEIEEED